MVWMIQNIQQGPRDQIPRGLAWVDEDIVAKLEEELISCFLFSCLQTRNSPAPNCMKRKRSNLQIVWMPSSHLHFRSPFMMHLTLSFGNHSFLHTRGEESKAPEKRTSMISLLILMMLCTCLQPSPVFFGGVQLHPLKTVQLHSLKDAPRAAHILHCTLRKLFYILQVAHCNLF